MNGPPQLPGTLPVDDPDLQDALPPARRDVVFKQIFYLGRAKGMEIEDSVDRKCNWLCRFPILFHNM